MNAIVFIPMGEVRKAKPGEKYLRYGDFLWNVWDTETEYPYPIYTRHEISAEVAQRMMEEVNNGIPNLG